MDNIKRRKSYAVKVGGGTGGAGVVTIGGNSPIAVQSMTNTDTADVDATFNQIMQLASAGSELVRVTVNNEDAARAIPRICGTLRAKNCEVPVVGDFHYNGHLLLKKFPECAKALDKYRINPGNVGSGKMHAYNFASIIECALKNNKPVRIGVNWGSPDQELLTGMMDENAAIVKRGGKPKSDNEVLLSALVNSALDSAREAERLGLGANKIILSVKTSEVQHVISAYEMLAAKCEYALHLGLTEAGIGTKGVIASSAAMAVLLQKGIGDTIRISLTPKAGELRTREVEACQLLLQTMGLRQFRPLVSSCPGCGRTGNDLFQKLAADVDAYVKERMPEWSRARVGGRGESGGLDGRAIEDLKIAVMGCVVNGPGEARHTDIALSLPGHSEKPIATVFIHGKLIKTLRGTDIRKDFLQILEEFIKKEY